MKSLVRGNAGRCWQVPGPAENPAEGAPRFSNLPYFRAAFPPYSGARTRRRVTSPALREQLQAVKELARLRLLRLRIAISSNNPCIAREFAFDFIRRHGSLRASLLPWFSTHILVRPTRLRKEMSSLKIPHPNVTTEVANIYTLSTNCFR